MTLQLTPALDRLDLLAAPVAECLQRIDVPMFAAEIDPAVADTAAMCERYGVAMDDSANCVLVAGKRGDVVTMAACVVLATTRADVNGLVRRRLDARKASFASMDTAVQLSGMEYGGITPFGLPDDWPVLIDSRVIERERAIYGSGVRHSKLFGPGSALLSLPGAEVVNGLGMTAS